MAYIKQIAIVLIFMLSGCVTTEIVEVPVMIERPAIQLPARLVLPTKSLTPDSTLRDTAMAYYKSLHKLLNRNKELRQLLK